MGYATIAAASFGLTLVFIKLASVKTSPIISNLVFTVIALFVQVCTFWYFKLRSVELSASPSGLVMSLVGGIFLGIYTTALFMTFSKIPVTKAAPIVYAGGILMAACFGMIWLNESVTMLRLIGVALLVTGLFFVF